MVRMIRFLWLMQLSVRAIRLVTPWIRRMSLATLSYIATTIITFWGRVPEVSGAIADEWVDRAVASGFPTRYDRHLYYLLYSLAFGMVVVGWLVMSFVTVALVLLIF